MKRLINYIRVFLDQITRKIWRPEERMRYLLTDYSEAYNDAKMSMAEVMAHATITEERIAERRKKAEKYSTYAHIALEEGNVADAEMLLGNAESLNDGIAKDEMLLARQKEAAGTVFEIMEDAKHNYEDRLAKCEDAHNEMIIARALANSNKVYDNNTCNGVNKKFDCASEEVNYYVNKQKSIHVMNTIEMANDPARICKKYDDLLHRRRVLLGIQAMKEEINGLEDKRNDTAS